MIRNNIYMLYIKKLYLKIINNSSLEIHGAAAFSVGRSGAQEMCGPFRPLRLPWIQGLRWVLRLCPARRKR
jgi:hypothetical protein